MSAGVESRIKEAADREAQLLDLILENDFGPDSLQLELDNIKDLLHRLDTSSRTIQNLDNLRFVHSVDHKRFRNSHMEKFMHTATGRRRRFDEKAQSQQRRYLQVIEKLQNEHENNSELAARLAASQKARVRAEDAATRYHLAKAELDHIFRSIFDGPTPEFPEEDEKEQAYKNAQKLCLDWIDSKGVEERAATLLEEAKEAMEQAAEKMREALNDSKMDVGQAQLAIQNAKGKLELARIISPSTSELPGVDIDNQSILSDVALDKSISDGNLHEKIKRGREEVQNCVEALTLGISQARLRQSELQKDIDKRMLELEEARWALQAVREQIFDMVSNGELTLGRDQALPEYTP